MSIEESVVPPPPLQTMFPGLYRGIVKQNDDRPIDDGGKADDKYGPLGRLRVLVPQVYGEDVQDDDLPWAWPCFPQGGIMKDNIPEGLVAIPQVDTQVWVMFEQGNPQSPVWVGTCYGAPERNDEETEIPKTAIDKDDRTQVEYPDIMLWQGRGPEGKEKAMMIRYLGDKRIDIYLDEDNYIELDTVGDPPDPAQIRVHSKDYQVKVDSEVKVLLNAPSIEIEGVDPEGGTTSIEMTADNITITGNDGVRVASQTIFAQGGVAGAFYHPPLGGHPSG